MPSLFPHFVRRAVLFGFSIAFLIGATAAHAADPPTFSDPEVTAFAKDYSKFVDDYAANMKDYVAATKANDTAKAEAISKKTEDLQTKQQNLQVQALLMQSKLKAEEVQRYSDFMDVTLKKLVDSMQPQ